MIQVLKAPCLAYLLASSFPIMFVWALSFLMVIFVRTFLNGINDMRDEELIKMVCEEGC